MSYSFFRGLGFILAACMSVLCSQHDAHAVLANDSAVLKRMESLGAEVTCDNDGFVRAIMMQDASNIAGDDILLLNSLTKLEKLHILNCRSFDDTTTRMLTGSSLLTSLAITNSAITDDAVQFIAEAFPNLRELDLSSNTGLTGTSMRSIASLEQLERLSLLQTRFNDLHTRRLRELKELRVLDLRGVMEAGDMTLGIVGSLPAIAAFKHRSTIVSDDGIADLAESKTLKSLFAQDFAISSAAGQYLAAMPSLESLEIFRCQGFGSDGVRSLSPLKKLNRLTLRDLPEVDDEALAVLNDLPSLKRLYLHELPSVGDKGLQHIGAAKNLEVLDIWALPRMTDATVNVIAGLPNLKELSIRETGVTEASLDVIASIPLLTSLTFKNGEVSSAAAAVISSRKLKKLDLGE